MTTLQDSQGFVWLGTEDGLVRYDGHELYRYAHSRTESGSLPGNYVWQIVEDAHADLWIATNDAGVAKWTRRSDSFTSYRHDPNDASSLASDRVRTVLIDARGYLWIGTFDAGVDVLDPSSGRIEHLRHDANDPASLGSDHVSTLALDRAGDVWIGTDKGLNRWRSDTRTLVRVGPPAGDAHSLSDVKISAVLEDQTGALWIGGAFNAGLVRMDRDGRVLETFRHDPRNPASLGSDDVRAILEDQAGHLWVGTADGLCAPRPFHACVQPLPPRRERRRVAARFIRDVAVSGPRRARLGRHTDRRRQPLGPAQLGARRASPGVAGKSVRHGLCGRSGQQRVDRLACRRAGPLRCRHRCCHASQQTRRPREPGRRRARHVAAAGPPRRAMDRHDRARPESADTGRPHRVDSRAAGRFALARRRRRHEHSRVAQR